MKKRALSILFVLVLALGLTTTALAAELPFKDVPSDAWYCQDVENAYNMGLINGRDETHFVPDANLTYGEAVKLAACMNQKALLGYVTEMDSGDPWYQPYIDYCREQGIISKDYPWDKNATRAGYVEIFAHALPEESFQARNDIPDGTIPDVSMSHPQAAEIYLFYRAGILTGNDAGGTFDPSSSIKRCQVAAILTRMFDEGSRKDVYLGAPAPDGDRRDEVAALAGYWETERPVDGDAYLFIEDDGSWSLYVWFEGDSQPVEQDRGTIVPSAGEPDAYYANSALDDSSTYFRFTPAEENDVGSDLILWGANPDDNSIVFLREE